MGGAVLANIAFSEVTYVLCETFSLSEEVEKYYESGEIYNFDFIFITDLFFEGATLEKIATDARLKNKLFIVDHHKSSIETSAKYPCSLIKVEDSLGLTSGTSLFYQLLIEKGFLTHEKALDQFVELTRRYDTWEWKTKYNDENAHELSLLFDSLGPHAYISFMTDKIKDSLATFSFSSFEKSLINCQKERINEKMEFYAQKMIVKDVCGYKAGIIFIEYTYRNDLAEYLRNHNYSIDFAIFIVLEISSISFRSIKDEVNVHEIAEVFGGGGHVHAASVPIKKEVLESIIDNLLHTK